ncbi:MAG: inositol monophosphatase [Chloroflexi bacterium HGW-Chloroflexi-3]|nr:MAG: inositol monophosphatase [Chloroflexi bacterium HGW-Chloroflexi-3]
MLSYKEVAILAAKEAGNFQKTKFRSSFQVREKSPANLVTEVDIQSEKIILDILTRHHSNIDFLTEEQSVSEKKNAEKCWIIDPLDGTTNFAHGYPLFGVSIALEIKGSIVLGVVFIPMLDEIFVAERGKGAYRNGAPIQVSHVNDLQQSLLASGFPYDAWTNSDNNTHEWAALLKSVVSCRCDGTAAIDLCHVAAGVLDGYWELDLEAWDMAAGSLIVEESGGHVSLPDGKSFNIYQRGILASNSNIHKALIEKLGR